MRDVINDMMERVRREKNNIYKLLCQSMKNTTIIFFHIFLLYYCCIVTQMVHRCAFLNLCSPVRCDICRSYILGTRLFLKNQLRSMVNISWNLFDSTF